MARRTRQKKNKANVVTNQPYNPLQKRNLAESIVRAILEREPRRLSDTDELHGAGVYIIYYTGDSPLYAPVAALNREGRFEQPIYIGKAIPKGGRKGGFADDDSAAKGKALKDRLGQHFASVREAENLDESDFLYRCLVVDEIFIPLGENMLIERFRPVWNVVIDGFGNKDPGRRRSDQYRSPWDVLHPGRSFANKLGEHPNTAEEFAISVKTFFETGKVAKPRKPPGVKGEEQKEEDSEES
jgi:hypothetical protein